MEEEHEEDEKESRHRALSHLQAQVIVLERRMLMMQSLYQDACVNYSPSDVEPVNAKEESFLRTKQSPREGALTLTPNLDQDGQILQLSTNQTIRNDDLPLLGIYKTTMGAKKWWRQSMDDNLMIYHQRPLPEDARPTVLDSTPRGTSISLSKRYQCPEIGCTRSFTSSGHTRGHSRVHDDNSKFECNYGNCTSTLTRADSHRQHRREIHAERYS